MSDFVHLRAHSSCSVEDGILEPSVLVEKAAAAGQPAVALTDLNRMFGVVPFYQSARKKGIKPILGADVWVEPDVTQPGDGGGSPAPVRLLLLCQNEEGYRSLMRYMSRAYLENHRSGKARIKQSWLRDTGTKGLIALSGEAGNGEIPVALLSDLTAPSDEPVSTEQARARAERSLAFYKEIFGDRFYLEVQRAAQPHESEFVARTAKLAADTGTPLVATHPIQFGSRQDFFAHEVRTCIDMGEQAEDPARVSRFTREQYFTTSEEMQRMFADLPEALENAAEVAKRCSSTITLGKNHLPNFPTPDGETQEAHFEKLARAGLETRLAELFPDEAERRRNRPAFDDRLNTEIATINKMGFAGYYLIVSDFINWSKTNGIMVGAGRGSGAGSLAAYALGITDIEPLRYELLFERFLNPERVSMPDFDIDFEPTRRGEVIEYVRQKYGELSVSQIATFNTLAAKAAIKDVARTLGFKPFFAQMLSDLVPKELDITLDDALAKSPRLKEKYDKDKGVRRVIDVARSLEGLPRTIGTHAGGVLIAPGAISDYSPLYVAEDGSGVVSQYTKDDVEKAGLVKFDFLGLSNLTVIQKTIALINERPEFQGKPFDIKAIDVSGPDSPAVYKALQQGDTMGVFQLEGEGITRTCMELKPDCFEDIIALLALFRPGPLNSGMVTDFIRRKHGEAEVSYPHAQLEPILKPTYGVMVYQEQVMQTAQVLAGYSLGGADLLRRAMGKKKPEEMAKERGKFEAGAKARGIDPAVAVGVFDLMEKFAEYGFNKSHSAAYAMIAYQTAWLKVNYPAEFYAAYMNATEKTDKLGLLIKSARAAGLAMLPPDVNEGVAEFRPVGDKAIRYGLAGLKGVGDAPIRAIAEARSKEGAFTSLFDFCKKVGRSVATKTVVETLGRAGAFDSLHPNRASVMASVKDGLDYAAKLAKKAKEEGVLLPELFADDPVAGAAAKAPRRRKKTTTVVEPMMTDAPEWSLIERMDEEKRAVGFYLSGHPFEGYAEKFGGLKAALPLSQVNAVNPEIEGDTLKLVAGVVSRVKEHTTGKGTKMAFLSIDDGMGARDLTVFPTTWEAHGSWIKPGVFLACAASVRADRRGGDHGNELAADDAYDFDRLQKMLATQVDVVVDRKQMARLATIVEKHKGDPGVPMTVYMPEGEDRYFKAPLLGVRVVPGETLLSDLTQAFGNDCVKLTYADSINIQPRPRPRQNNGPRRR